MKRLLGLLAGVVAGAVVGGLLATLLHTLGIAAVLILAGACVVAGGVVGFLLGTRRAGPAPRSHLRAALGAVVGLLGFGGCALGAGLVAYGAWISTGAGAATLQGFFESTGIFLIVGDVLGAIAGFLLARG